MIWASWDKENNIHLAHQSINLTLFSFKGEAELDSKTFKEKVITKNG